MSTKIFIGKGSWRSKVNFVDDNNVLLGYDNDDDCCANGGWFISDSQDSWEEKSFVESEMVLQGFNFDPTYRREVELKESYDEGGATQFRLKNEATGETKYLTLYNHHNGYYSRNFEFVLPDKKEIGRI